MDNKIKIREYEIGDASYIAYMQVKHYFEVHGWKKLFEYYVLQGIADFLKETEGSNLWVATLNDKIVGSIAAVKIGDNPVLLRWFIIDESVRGQGLGRRFMDIFLKFCEEKNYNHIVLWTESQMLAARHLYGEYGFELTETVPNDEWADYTVYEEKWELYKNN